MERQSTHAETRQPLRQPVQTEPCGSIRNEKLVGNLNVRDKKSFELILSLDVDLAEDLETTKSTSRLWIELQSADCKRCWPITWHSKLQGSTVSSSCEAETISIATALKSEALPLLDIFSEAMNRRIMLEFREDNDQCISAFPNGIQCGIKTLAASLEDCPGRRQRDVCF